MQVKLPLANGTTISHSQSLTTSQLGGDICSFSQTVVSLIMIVIMSASIYKIFTTCSLWNSIPNS